VTQQIRIKLLESILENCSLAGLLLMPAIKIPGSPYRFSFFSNERNEPPHVHVKRENRTAKFWIKPVSLASSQGFASHELNKIENLVIEHQSEIERAWNEYFPE
jgi:hypothetical protein